MACACKVNRDIERINKYYSYNKDSNENKTRMTVNKKDALKTIIIYTLLLPLLPLVFIGVLLFTLFSKDGMISMKKFLGFIHKARNGRK